ncbi:hypothetical protein LOAG_13646 [Loa loa]|uniref:Uncharacterized protein n=1 Tax=Loa loa TaxID=7209 RepID=A0A1S0TJ24_LOALO|nr:hypothetical protein LOAG_13646 [Loa loa]EFO14869.2 hypothetical protein LOAG_13646 [Loa loa]
MLIEDHSFFAPENKTLRTLYEQGEKLHLIGQNYNKTVQHGCIRKVFLPLHDPFCTLLIPVLTNLIQCSCFQSPLLQQPCDADFGTKVRKEGPKIAIGITLIFVITCLLFVL